MAKGSAGGKGGTEVGRIYIRVVPDADGFHANLRRQIEGSDDDLELKTKATGLDKVRKQAREATKGLEAKVDVQADTTKAERTTDLFQKRLLGNLNKHLTNLEAKIPLTPDGERFRRQVERAAKELKSDIKAEIPIEATLAAEQRAKVLGEVEAVKKLAERDAIQLKLDPQFDYKLRQRLSKFKPDPIKLELDPQFDYKLRKQLAKFKPEPIKLQLDPQFDYKLHKRVADIMRKANEEQLKQEQDFNKRLKAYHDQLYEDKHKTRIADWRKELQLMKEREAETRKFTDDYRRELEEQKVARMAPDADFRRTMLSDLKKAAKDLEASLEFNVDGEKLRRDLRAEVEAIEREIEAEIPVDLELAAAQRAKIKAAIESIRARVPVDVDTKKLGRFNQFARNWGNFALPNFGTGINPAGYAVILGAILAVAAPLVGLITTAFLSLPGLIALIATPLAAVTLGLEGFKRAAEKIKPQFEDLQKSMSAVAETKFTPIMQQIADNIFPMLKRSLPSVIDGLRNMSQGVINAITEPVGAQRVENTIRNIGTALHDAAPGVQSFTSGIIGLANTLSEKFPSIVSWFNDAGFRFQNWVNQAIADGSLSESFDGLGRSLKYILDTVVDLGGKGIDFMKDPEKVAAFNAELKGVLETVKGLVDLSDKFLYMFRLPGKFMDWWDSWGITGERGPNASDGWETVKSWFGGSQEAAAEEGKKTGQSYMQGFQQAMQQPGANLTDLLLGAGGTTGAPPPAMEIPPPNLEPAKAEVTEYQSFIDNVTQQVRGALSQATSGETLPAPNFEAFKAAWTGLYTFISEQVASFKAQGQLVGDALGSGMSGFVDKAKAALAGLPAATAPHFQAMKQQAITAFTEIETAAGELPGKIGSQLGGLAGIGHSAGLQLMSGLTAGMQAGEGSMLAYVDTIAGKIAQHKGPLPYDRKVLVPNGEALMEGLGVGLATGFEDVLARAKSMAEQISEAVSEGTSVENLLGGNKLPALQKMLDTLEEQRKVLKVQKNNTSDKEEKKILTDKMSQLQAMKDELSLIKDQHKNTNQYGTEVESVSEMWDQMFQKVFDMPFNFAKATGSQILSDLGMGGGGALTTLAEGLIDWGINAGKKFIFNVNSVDEALSAQRNLTNREALQFTR
ncbi:tape measure protein [Mycobacterium phage Ghoulboy]|nr:tape measure protein [Mycobacterium phage Ghoulboy]